jgi:hypothetical protein
VTAQNSTGRLSTALLTWRQTESARRFYRQWD